MLHKKRVYDRIGPVYVHFAFVLYILKYLGEMDFLLCRSGINLNNLNYSYLMFDRVYGYKMYNFISSRNII